MNKISTAILMSKLVFCFYILTVFASCNFEPKEEFAKKKKIGICQQNQGMISYEVNLYSDSTFYLPSDKGFINYSFGEFRIKNDTIYFFTKGGEINLCDKYLLNRNRNVLSPFSCSNSKYQDKLIISFNK